LELGPHKLICGDAREASAYAALLGEEISDFAKRATAMVRGLKILLTFGYAENAFNHNGPFDPGVKLLSVIATSLLVSSAGC
jgi:hypothetical protein